MAERTKNVRGLIFPLLVQCGLDMFGFRRFALAFYAEGEAQSRDFFIASDGGAHSLHDIESLKSFSI